MSMNPNPTVQLMDTKGGTGTIEKVRDVGGIVYAGIFVEERFV